MHFKLRAEIEKQNKIAEKEKTEGVRECVSKGERLSVLFKSSFVCSLVVLRWNHLASLLLFARII